MRRYEEDLAELGIKVVVVTFEADSFARLYAQETNLPWPLMIDENRELYRAYGMLAAGFWDIWGPKSWWVYMKEIVRGRLPKKSTGDISQRGGDVLIDPAGMVRFHHVGQGPSDRPSPEAILRIARPESTPRNKNNFHDASRDPSALR